MPSTLVYATSCPGAVIIQPRGIASTRSVQAGVFSMAGILLSTSLRNGATLAHVKRYLGQVSEKMAEHYVHLASTDPALEDALNAIWVSGPGAAEPGMVLSAGPGDMTPEQAQALMIDLTRTSTPAEGGFCTFQPVIRGGACPRNLNCHSCENFVMSGADLLYWRRKQEQWATLGETRARRRDRRLPPRRVRPDRPRHQRPGTGPACRRAARRCAAAGPAPPAGLLHAAVERGVPRSRSRTLTRRRRTSRTRTSRAGHHHTAQLMSTEPARTGPAIAARRQRTTQMLTRVENAVTRLRLDGTPVTVRALAQHARVSATFLYGNPSARVLLSSARDAAASGDAARSAARAAQAEAYSRERARNAEDALSHAHTEILPQRRRIGELAGTLRDLETPLSADSAQLLAAENSTLHQRIRQLTDEHRTLRERLDAARSAGRFLDRRVADLEAQLAEHIVHPT